MNLDPLRPDGDISVRVTAAFTDRAVRAALHAGYRPTRNLDVWVQPGDSMWDEAVTLLHKVVEEEEQLLVVNPSTSTILQHAAPSDLLLGWAKKIPYWPHPRLTVVRGSKAQPLDHWPADTAELLRFAREAEVRTSQDLSEHLDELADATERWWAAVDDRIYRLRALIDEWGSNPFLVDEVIEGGSVEPELKVLMVALEAFVKVSGITTFRIDAGVPSVRKPVVQAIPPFVDRPVAAVEADVVTADEGLHAAIDAAMPGIHKGLEAQNREQQRLAEIEEAAEWVEQYGSARLKKAVEAGVLANSLGVYRDERLALERPDWMWVARADNDTLRKAALNPSEEALTALLDARSIDPNVYLAFHTGARAQVLVGTFLQRRVWRPVTTPKRSPNTRNGRVVTVQSLFPSAYDPSEEPF